MECGILVTPPPPQLLVDSQMLCTFPRGLGSVRGRLRRWGSELELSVWSVTPSPSFVRKWKTETLECQSFLNKRINVRKRLVFITTRRDRNVFSLTPATYANSHQNVHTPRK